MTEVILISDFAFEIPVDSVVTMCRMSLSDPRPKIEVLGDTYEILVMREYPSFYAIDVLMPTTTETLIVYKEQVSHYPIYLPDV